MAITNFNNQHITAEEYSNVQQALTTLQEILGKYFMNLTSEERKKYGSINEQNKLFVNKTYDFHKTQPQLQAPDVDWEEFERDYTSRQRLETIISILDSFSLGLSNAKILHDNDNYQSALTDYAYTTYKANTRAVGFEKKYNEQRQFFIKGKGKMTTEVEKNTSEGAKNMPKNEENGETRVV